MDKNQLDEEAIGVLVDSRVRESVGWFNSKLSTERESVIKYYNCELPKRQSDGNSSYVSTDVYDSVEGMKAQLVETFAAGYEIARFDPVTQKDVEPARIATAYTDYIVFRQNDGYKIFTDVIHDGLTSRVGIAKVHWDAQVEYEDHETEDLTSEEVDGLIVNDEIESMDVSADEATGMFSGKIKKKISKSQVRIEVISPEQFVILPQARELSADYFCAHRVVKTIADLIAMGYDKKKLKNYNIENDSTLQNSPEVLARFSQIDSGFRSDSDGNQDELRQVLVNECYIKLVKKGQSDNTPRLYKVVRCGAETLECTEVDELPFVVFTPLPIPHSFYGNNFAKLVIPAQKARTVLMRGILDHTAITNNPRYMVLKGGLTNPRELLDNRLGGLVNTTRPDAVMPLPQASLNPFVYQTLELIKVNNEETTGISSLSQGLNKDAISKQNSAALIENLVSLSQTRQKIIARNFASFLKQLYIKSYNLVVKHEDRKNVVELAGNWEEIDPRLWMERKTATVSLHLGYGEQEREAQKYMTLLSMAAQDPDLERMVGEKGKYNVATTVMKLNGMKDINNFLVPPDQLPPKQPDPMVIKQIQQADRQLDIQDKAATAQIAKVELTKQVEDLKQQFALMKEKFEESLKVREQSRKEADTANQIDVAQREMRLAESQPSISNETKTIISPNA